jgi:uncharacterized protein (TIGR01777 family)
MKKIVLTGGSGFIGTQLTQKLLDEGYSVCIFDIAPPKIKDSRVTFVRINMLIDEIPQNEISGSFGVIHLAGAPIFHRWTASYKKEIIDSRIVSTEKIVTAIGRCAIAPSVFVCASAVGYYGDSDNLLNEESAQGKDFLAEVCARWEEEAQKATLYNVRVVTLRTAHVLGNGGMLGVLVPLFKKWIGGYFGKGSQYMPWVHYQDIISLYLFALTHPLSGPYNTASGVPITQKEFMNILAKEVRSPIVWRIPLFAVRLLYGEFSQVFTISQKVSSQKIKNEGYVFQYEDLGKALKNILIS